MLVIVSISSLSVAAASSPSMSLREGSEMSSI